MITSFKTSALLIIPLVTTACGHTGLVKENESTLQIAPAEMPIFEVGMRFPQINKLTGERQHWTVIDVDSAGNVTALNSDDCAWSVPPEHFTPATSWDNCGTNPNWLSGTRTITSTEGTLWPLQVGSKATYKHSYSSPTETERQAVDECLVTSQVQVDTDSGPIDTYRVDCRRDHGESYDIRTWYWSPDSGPVIYSRIHSTNGPQHHVEMLPVEYVTVDESALARAEALRR